MRCYLDDRLSSSKALNEAEKLTARERRELKDEAEERDRLSDDDLARLFDEGEPVEVRLRRPHLKTE